MDRHAAAANEIQDEWSPPCIFTETNTYIYIKFAESAAITSSSYWRETRNWETLTSVMHDPTNAFCHVLCYKHEMYKALALSLLIAYIREDLGSQCPELTYGYDGWSSDRIDDLSSLPSQLLLVWYVLWATRSTAPCSYTIQTKHYKAYGTYLLYYTNKSRRRIKFVIYRQSFWNPNIKGQQNMMNLCLVFLHQTQNVAPSAAFFSSLLYHFLT